MGFFDSIGTVVNDVLGGTTSARKANKYALGQMNAQNAYNKETMQNLHQWEVADLQKAGLNPILSAGGSTSALGTSTASGPSSMAGGNPISMAAQIFDMINTSANTAKTESDKNLKDAQTAEQIAKNQYVDESEKARIANIVADTALKNAEKNSAKETAKYTKERSRGYTDSETRSSGKNFWGLSGNVSRTVTTTR